MERIKQAIEKARQLSPNPGPRHRWTSHGEVSHTPRDDLREVHYSQTRVVQLDPAHLERNRVVAFNKRDPLSASFDLLRTQVLHKMDENNWRTLAVISPTAGCGKTVVAINLAISIAHHSNKTAMLVDFDLRRPKVGEYLGVVDGVSLSDVLDGDADVADIMVNPGLPKLVILPTAKPVLQSAEVLSSKKVEGLIHELRERYQERIVLFDLPPLLNSDDAITLLPRVDCALLVIGNGVVSKAELEESRRHLNGVNLLGVVLNMAEYQPKDQYY